MVPVSKTFMALAAAATTLLLVVPLQAQIETVPEAIARGATGRVSTSPSGRPPSIDAILQETDAILRGVVTESRSYLSQDQTEVYTEHTLKQAAVIYQPRVDGAPTPGLTPIIAFSQLGGTLNFNGVMFRQVENGLPLLGPGTEGVFFLKKVGSRYHLAGTFFGAFGIKNGTLQPLTPIEAFAPEYRGVPASAAIENLVARIKSLGNRRRGGGVH